MGRKLTIFTAVEFDPAYEKNKTKVLFLLQATVAKLSMPSCFSKWGIFLNEVVGLDGNQIIETIA